MHMNKILALHISLLLTTAAYSQNLKDTTVGFGTGVRYNFTKTFDYSLSTDTMHALKLQRMPNTAFVISSIISVKFAKLKVDTSGNKNMIRKQDGNNIKRKDKLALNIALNLLEVKSDASFNKDVDGGIGLGYFIHQSTQLALMIDIARVRQLRDYIAEAYENKRIPNGTSYYNALDTGDSNLFSVKTVAGISFKAVFSF